MSQSKQKSSKQSVETKLQEIELIQKRLELAEGLPFLHGWKWYPWARAFFESTNKINLLCAANQISKSSTQIRKAIDWATNKPKWPLLWRRKPIQFWYLYPSQKVVNAEFLTKWKEFLPSGKFKDDPVYGWKVIKEKHDILGIEFFSGVYLFFKTYAQDAQNLQSGTCDAIFCDEELPIELLPELQQRLTANDGYFHMVFTATLGQEFWRKAMEPYDWEEPTLPNALKMTVSMYDCLFYEDGEPSYWTKEKIQEIEARCPTHNDVLRRVYGKFIVDITGRKYPQFDMKKHMKPWHPVPKDWFIYGGVDVGAGGKTAHPAAIAFVAVRTDYRAGRVFIGWRGDGIRTTAGDVMDKFRELRVTNNLRMTEQRYDWGSADFGTIAVRLGEPFLPANKSHDMGEDMINTLFKNDMLFVYESEELNKLAVELSTLRKETPKTKAKDDLIDAVRYAISAVPWDWTALTVEGKEEVKDAAEQKLSPLQQEIADRRKAHFGEEEDNETQRVEDELSEWNELYG